MKLVERGAIYRYSQEARRQRQIRESKRNSEQDGDKMIYFD